MNEPNSVEPTIRFDTFEVDLRARELRKRGLRLKIEEKPFQVLELLLERSGQMVTRVELREKLWPDTFVCFDRSLNTAVNKLRQALGDSATSPRFIETLSRRGYRFVAPVTRPGAVAARTPSASAPIDSIADLPFHETIRRRKTSAAASRRALPVSSELGFFFPTCCTPKGPQKLCG